MVQRRPGVRPPRQPAWYRRTVAAKNAAPRLTDSRGNDATAKAWNGAGHYLKEIGGQIATCRGKEICSGSTFAKLGEYLDTCSNLPNLPPPFRPLIDTIAAKIAPFKENDLENCLQAVAWCIEHNLVQQGITLLQEGLVSLIAQRHGLDWQKEADRSLVSDLLCVKGQEKPEEDWGRELKKRPDIANRIFGDPLVGSMTKEFDRLTKARNDLNHGGFTEPKKAKEMKQVLQSSHTDICTVWERLKNTSCCGIAGDATRQKGGK